MRIRLCNLDTVHFRQLIYKKQKIKTQFKVSKLIVSEIRAVEFDLWYRQLAVPVCECICIYLFCFICPNLFPDILPTPLLACFLSIGRPQVCVCFHSKHEDVCIVPRWFEEKNEKKMNKK